MRTTGLVLLALSLLHASFSAAQDSFPALLRLDEQTPQAIDCAHDVTAPRADTIHLFPAENASAWIPREASTRCEVRDGILFFSTDGPGAITNPAKLDLYGPGVDSVALRMRVKGARKLLLSWRPADQIWEWADGLRHSVYTISIPRQNEELTYVIRVAEFARFQHRSIEELRLITDGPAEVEIRSVEIRMNTAQFNGAPTGACSYKMANSLRRCLYVHAPASMEYALTLPPETRFSSGLGVVGNDAPVTFSVELRQGKTSTTLFSKTVEPGKGWDLAAADLGVFAGTEATLALKTTCQTPGTVALWSNPVVVHARKPEASTNSPNILLYIVDALRADRLSVYGYSRDTTPHIRDFARDSVLFTRCFAQETCTRPSMTTLATGVDMLVHGSNCFGPCLGGEITAALTPFSELLRKAGYLTAAITQNPYTPPMPPDWAPYDRVEDLNEASDTVSDDTLRSVSEYLNSVKDQPFFLYVHTMECHGKKIPTGGRLGHMPPSPLREVIQDPSAASATDRYDASVLYADDNFGRLADELRNLNLTENTLVVFMADHGEALGEHEDDGHGMNPYMDQIHIPLLMRWPARFPGGRTVGENVQILDLAPTFLDAAHCVAPPYYSGLSLLPLIRGESVDQFVSRPIFSFMGVTPFRALPESVVLGDWYLLMELLTFHPHLYNLANDPGVREDVIQENPDRYMDLYGRAARYYQSQAKLRADLSPAGKGQEDQVMNPQKEESLRALGYMR